MNNRPVIGRLGIGLLGIAQICPSFTITSQTKKGGFRAKVNLYDFLREKLDRDDASVVTVDDTTRTEIVDIGKYEFDDEFQPMGKPGTQIIAHDVHPTFTRAFRDSLEFEKFKKPPREWAKAIGVFKSVRSLQELGDYWRLLWELSVACPVPYVSANAVPERLVADEQAALRSFDFRVAVDSTELYKPVLLRGNPGGYTTTKIDEQTRKIYGKELKFHGYIVVQEGKQLAPDELRGILIRIRNVGIGYYDPSLLDYRINEGPRSRWMTGEIYVDEGLEDALNIDRDSFNRFHPEFRSVQEYVHKLLQTKIFPRVYKQIDVRSKKRSKTRSRSRTQKLRAVVASKVRSPVVVRFSALSKPESRRHHGKLLVTAPKPDSLRTRKPQRELASAILTIFEVAIRQKTSDQQREVFRDLLLELLRGW